MVDHRFRPHARGLGNLPLHGPPSVSVSVTSSQSILWVDQGIAPRVRSNPPLSSNLFLPRIVLEASDCPCYTLALPNTLAAVTGPTSQFPIFVKFMRLTAVRKMDKQLIRIEGPELRSIRGFRAICDAVHGHPYVTLGHGPTYGSWDGNTDV
jgi:hypothetical protein